MNDLNTQQASVSVLVDVPVGQAWEKLQDFSLAHNYVPKLTRTKIVSTVRSGLGAHRHVYTGSKYIEETIVQWNEGQGFTIKLHKGAQPMPPFQLAEFDYLLSEQSLEQTRIELTLRFAMPWGVIGKFLGRSMMLPVMRKQLLQIAAGVKHFYETGNPATDADRKRLAGTVETVPAVK